MQKKTRKKAPKIFSEYISSLFLNLFVALDLLLSWAFLNPEIDNVYIYTREIWVSPNAVKWLIISLELQFVDLISSQLNSVKRQQKKKTTKKT